MFLEFVQIIQVIESILVIRIEGTGRCTGGLSPSAGKQGWVFRRVTFLSAFPPFVIRMGFLVVSGLAQEFSGLRICILSMFTR